MKYRDIIKETFEDPHIEEFLQEYSSNFSNNLEDNKAFIEGTNIYLNTEIRTGKELKTAGYITHSEQEEIYLGFETEEERKSFIYLFNLKFNGQLLSGRTYKVQV